MILVTKLTFLDQGIHFLPLSTTADHDKLKVKMTAQLLLLFVYPGAKPHFLQEIGTGRLLAGAQTR